MNRRLIGLAVSAGVAVAFVAAVTVATAGPKQALAPKGPVAPPGRMGLQLEGVNFVSNCGFSHRNQDDPIVFPGDAGRSHDHTFLANNSTNAWSTLESLKANATTTCRNRPGDTAGYWVPTLIANGQAVVPQNATIYYRRKTVAPVQAPPQGLKIVAGNSKSTSAQDLRVTSWNCGPEAGIRPQSTIPACPAARGEGLRLHVDFPNCWDGKNLDSADHQSHMAYSLRGACPADHPVAVPAIQINVNYGQSVPQNAVLSSGGQLTGHGDFFNAWDQATLQSLVAGCLNALRHCQGRS